MRAHIRSAALGSLASALLVTLGACGGGGQESSGVADGTTSLSAPTATVATASGDTAETSTTQTSTAQTSTTPTSAASDDSARASATPRSGQPGDSAVTSATPAPGGTADTGTVPIRDDTTGSGSRWSVLALLIVLTAGGVGLGVVLWSRRDPAAPVVLPDAPRGPPPSTVGIRALPEPAGAGPTPDPSPDPDLERLCRALGPGALGANLGAAKGTDERIEALIDVAELEADNTLATLAVTLLRRYRVVRFGQIGQPLDGRHHRVVDQVPITDPARDRLVLSVDRAGWIDGDGRVLRPAAVTVAVLRPDPVP